MAFENPLTGKYTIDLSTEGKIQVRRPGLDDVEINVPENYSLTQPYIVRFSRMDGDEGSLSGKYVMYNDINGMSSEVIVDPKDIRKGDRIKDIQLDTDYLFFVFAEGEDGEEMPVYIQLSNLENDIEKNYIKFD